MISNPIKLSGMFSLSFILWVIHIYVVKIIILFNCPDQLGILQSAKQTLGIRDMEETTSEVTSPCLTSQMAYGPMYDQLNNALAWNSRQHTNVGIVHSQANQFQLVQGEPSEASEQPRARRCRPKLNEDQRRENKRQCDIKYRLNQKVVKHKCLSSSILFTHFPGKVVCIWGYAISKWKHEGTYMIMTYQGSIALMKLILHVFGYACLYLSFDVGFLLGRQK